MRWMVGMAMVTVIARAERAEACSCLGSVIEVSPKDVAAPLNTTIVVRIPDRAKTDTRDELVLSVRKKATGETLVVDYRKLGAASVTTMEMVPKAKLAPNTEYEIVRGTDLVIGHFTTGTHELTGAPVWHGVSRAVYVQEPKVCCNCSTGDPYAEVVLMDKPAPGARIGIWLAGRDGKIDYKQPPAALEDAYQHVYLGHPSTCAPPNFVWPKAKALKVGVRLFDLAGNASTPSEVVLDTTQPQKAP